MLTGRDLLGIAQTGTGKTAAFVLPSLHRLAADSEIAARPTLAGCSCSRRPESLPAQIADSARAYGQFIAAVGRRPFRRRPDHKNRARFRARR